MSIELLLLGLSIFLSLNFDPKLEFVLDQNFDKF